MVVELAQQHGLPLYLSLGRLLLSWSRARQGRGERGVSELNEALEAYSGQGNRWYLPLFTGLLAEVELEVRGAKDTLPTIDTAIALANETGERWTDALLHRVRGEILLERDAVDTTPAGKAFLAAIAIAQQQKTRSFELRAALSLAKLYQSSGRAAEAHAVLAPALEGFSPTPEMPEIAEAVALLAALAQ